MTKNEAIANWWCKIISNPIFNNGTEEQGGSPLAGIMAMMLAIDNRASDTNIELFRQNMIKFLDKNPNVRHFDVDYAPDNNLASIAKESGISLDQFPWKTHMAISDIEVAASYGYAQPFKIVWNKDMQ